MAMPTLTVMGMCNYDNTLFDDMVLPDGLDRDNVIANIIMECAELEVLYPNIIVFKMAIMHWSKKNLPIWEKMKTTTEFDYNPIHNLNRDEIWEDVSSGSRTTSGDEDNGRDAHGETISNSQNGGSDSSEQKVSAYDSSNYQPREQNITTYGQTNNVDGNSTLNETFNRTYGENEGHNENSTRKGHSEGSIGVITTQTMIKQEREVSQFNIIDFIINDFKRRFCLLIY